MREHGDAELLDSFVATHSDEAFAAILERYGSLVYSLCRGELRRAELAEDASQAVFLLLARRAEQLRVRTSLVGWLYATSRLVCKAARREERRRMSREVSLDERLAAPGSDDATLDLQRALGRLSAVEREAVVLRFLRGLAFAEVAEVQGTTEEAARKRVDRALDRMRPALAGHGEARLSALTAPPTLLASTVRAASPAAQALAKTTTLMIATKTAALATVAASFALVGAAATHAPSAEAAHPPAPERVAGQAKEPEFLSKLKKAKPTPPIPEIVSLDKPFTLVYKLTMRNLATKAMLEAALAGRIKELQKEVDEDRTTQEKMDKEIAAARAEPTPRTETITIAYDGKVLLYESAPDYGDDPRPTINLFDGKYTYFFWPKVAGGKQSPQAERVNGTVQYWTWNMPYVGPSVPYFAVTQGQNILWLPSFDLKPVYIPWGSVETAKGGVAKRILTGRFDPQDEVVLTNWKRLNGTFVAGSSVMTRRAYQAYLAPEDQGKPERRLEYTLLSAKAEVDPTQFDPLTYLSDGEDYEVRTGPRNQGPTIRFKFDRSKGSLSEQIAAHNGTGQ